MKNFLGLCHFNLCVGGKSVVRRSLFALSVLAVGSLCACEVSYKTQDDAMYYTDRGLQQIKKIENFAKSRFDKNYHPVIDELPLHLSNFDTFVCDGARQIIANFDRQEMTVSVKFDGKNKFLTRQDTYYPFSDKIHDLFVMQDGSLLLQKDGATQFQHCRPFVADSKKSQPFTAGGAPAYQYTPTISPSEYSMGDTTFNNRMNK